MKVWGISESGVYKLADEFGLQIKNPRVSGKAFQFRTGIQKGVPRRRSPGSGDRPGRPVQSPTFSRMAMFMLALFYQGAVRVQSSMGDWRSDSQLIDDLSRIYDINIGNQMYPMNLGDPEVNESDEEMEKALSKIAPRLYLG